MSSLCAAEAEGLIIGGGCYNLTSQSLTSAGEQCEAITQPLDNGRNLFLEKPMRFPYSRMDVLAASGDAPAPDATIFPCLPSPTSWRAPSSRNTPDRGCVSGDRTPQTNRTVCFSVS